MSVIIIFNTYDGKNQHKTFASVSDAQEWVISQEEVAEINNFQFVRVITS